MNIGNILIFIFAIILGAFMVVYGGIDDSPGAQLIGVVVIITGMVVVIKGRKKSK